MRPQSALWVLAVAMLLAASAWGQIFGVSSTNFGGATVHGVPPSVTSFGFGGTPGFRGVPPSVTSLNFSGAPVHTFAPGFGFRGRPPGFGHHRGFGSPFPGAVYYVPYAYPVYVMEPGVDDTMEEDYRGGPTIFDRRGPGPHEYTQRRAVEVEPEDYRTDIHRHTPEAEPVQPSAPQPLPDRLPTLLVFKDGHRQEVSNYAIVGEALYDLRDGRTRKIALADLDLAATVQQNDARGVSFQLPAASKAN